MSNLVDDQLSAYGVAQVMVILKQPARAAVAKPSAALAAAIPLARSRSTPVSAESVVMQLGKYFHIAETGIDTALALAGRARKWKSDGLKWYARAKSASNPTPSAPCGQPC